MIIIMHLLTAVLIVLKLLGHIAISWWLVFTPSILAFVFAFLIVLGLLAGGVAASQKRW